VLNKDIRLRVFYEAARHKSFTKAAEALFLTQPAVSFQIKALEEDLGVRLFHREKNRVLLTEAGQLLFGYAGQIRDLYDRAETEISRLAQHVGGQLAVGVVSVIAKYIIAKPIGAFKKRHPLISIVIETGNTDTLIGRVRGGHVDLAMVSDPVTLRDHVIDPWIEDELLLIVPADHRWASVETVSLDDVLAKPFVLREDGSGSRRVFERYLAERGVTVKSLNVVTGLTVTYPEILGKQLELLTELMPGLSRVAVIRDPDAISPQVHLTQRSVIQTAARSRRVSIDFIEVRSPSDLNAAFRRAVQDRRRAVMVNETPMIFAHRPEIVELAHRSRLPTIGQWRPSASTRCLSSRSTSHLSRPAASSPMGRARLTCIGTQQTTWPRSSTISHQPSGYLPLRNR
jgi:DNA-binding transcriptional LysR family regulator